MKKSYDHEKFVEFVLCRPIISRNNHITSDVRPLTCSVPAYVALGQKSLETPALR